MFRGNLLSRPYKFINQQHLVRQYLKTLGKQSQQTLNYCSVVKKSANEFEVQESEDLNFNYQHLNIPKDLKLEKLENLHLKEKIDLISKPGSFTADLFLGKIDTDFLFYPKLITDRTEYLKLNRQNVAIQRFFRDLVCKEGSEELLKSYGFFNVWRLSMTEQCAVFESMGNSMSNDILIKQVNFKFGIIFSIIFIFSIFHSF